MRPRPTAAGTGGTGLLAVWTSMSRLHAHASPEHRAPIRGGRCAEVGYIQPLAQLCAQPQCRLCGASAGHFWVQAVSKCVCVCVSSLRSQYSSRSLRGHRLAREHQGVIPILRYQTDWFGGDYCSWAPPPPTGHSNVAGGGWFLRSAMLHLVKLVESPLKVEPRRGADQIHLMSPSVPSVLSCTARCAPVVACGCCAS